MIIYHSGTESRYGKVADEIVFCGCVMMTFEKLRQDKNELGRFWELLKQRRKPNASSDP